MKSIIQKEKRCILTGAVTNLEEHHLFGGAGRRAKSEAYGLKVWLSGDIHQLTTMEDAYIEVYRPLGIERISVMSLLHIIGQIAFEDKHGGREAFIQIFGRNYL